MRVLVLSQNKVLQRFAGRIPDDKVVDRVQQVCVEEDLEAPCVLVEVWRRSVAPFSDVLQLLDMLALFSHIISTSSSAGRHSSSCSCDSLRMLL